MSERNAKTLPEGVERLVLNDWVRDPTSGGYVRYIDCWRAGAAEHERRHADDDRDFDESRDHWFYAAYIVGGGGVQEWADKSAQELAELMGLDPEPFLELVADIDLPPEDK